MKHPLGKKVALALASSVLTLVLAIAALELWASRRVGRAPDRWSTHVRLNHANKPNAVRSSKDFLVPDPDWPEPFEDRTNSQGWYRDTDVPLAKPDDTWRIFYVGDSFTAGPVPGPQRVPSVVEAYLAKNAASSGKRFEVINAATWSYSPSLYYITIRYFLRPYSPDAIVLNVDMTDDYDDWKYSFQTVTDRDGLPWAVLPSDSFVPSFVETSEGTLRASWFAPVQLFLYKNSYFYNWLTRRAQTPRHLAEPRIPTEEIYQRWSWCREDWDPITAKNAGRTLGLVREIARYCKREGIRLAITGVPHWEQYSGGEGGKPLWSNRPHRELAKVAREEGVGWFDSWQALEPDVRGSRQEQFYYRGDMHLNPRGNALWARAHVRAVSDPALHLLPDAVYPTLR